jgi:hypothetical protein
MINPSNSLAEDEDAIAPILLSWVDSQPWIKILEEKPLRVYGLRAKTRFNGLITLYNSSVSFSLLELWAWNLFQGSQLSTLIIFMSEPPIWLAVVGVKLISNSIDGREPFMAVGATRLHQWTMVSIQLTRVALWSNWRDPAKIVE